MIDGISNLIDRASNYLSDRKGLLPIIGIGLILGNLLVVILFSATWIAQTNILLHVGLIITILGFLIAPIL